MAGRFWTNREVVRALKLREAGLTTQEIADALGDRTEGGVRDMFYRMSHPNVRRSAETGGPIGETFEDRHFANDAVNGSARLLAEIERVFGRAA